MAPSPRHGQHAADAVGSLQLQEARWEAILDTLRDGLISVDGEGRITLFNRAAEEIFGYAAVEVLGQNVSRLMPAPYCHEHDEYIRAYQRSRVPRAIGRVREVFGRRKSGELFPVELSVSEAKAGEEVLYSAIVRDASERKRTEAVLRRLSKVFMDAADPIVISDLDGCILDVNAEAERVYGWTRAELVGRFIKDTIVPPERHSFVDEWYRRCGRGEHVRNIEGLRRDRAGRVWPVLLTFSLLTGESGEPEAVAELAKDLTERRRVEAERLELLKHAQQRERLADIGVMTAKLAHDLGNPVAGVGMAAQRILRRVARAPNDPLESVRDVAEHIAQAARRLDALLSELKDFARGQQLEMMDISLGDFLQDVAALWEPQAVSRGIRLAADLPPGLPVIVGDADRLRRVFDNLLKNAIEAINCGPGHVRLRAELPRNGKVLVFVEDSGPGIAPDIDVFKLFETTKPEGTGLGLPICKQILEAHGGGIGFASGRHRGTVFHVELSVEGPSVRGRAHPPGR